MPFFTVIIPTYNRARFVCAAIESVLAQSFQDFELIVVDDGSTDGTGPLIASSFEDSRLKFFTKTNEGASEARNYALRHARGQWIAFLDSDDLWQPAKLENVYDCIQKQAGVDFIHTGHASDRSPKKCLDLSSEQMNVRTDQAGLLGTFLIKTSTLAIDSALIKDESVRFGRLKTCGDYVFFWKALCYAKKVVFLEICDTIVRFSGDNLTTSNKMSDKFLDNLAAIDHVLKWMNSVDIKYEYNSSLSNLRYWQIRNLISASILEKRIKLLWKIFIASCDYYSVYGAFRLFANAIKVCVDPATRSWLQKYSLQQYE